MAGPDGEPLPKRSRVGVRTRLGDHDEPRQSRLMDVLVEEMGLGFLSAPALVRIAGAAAADGLVSTDVSAAAKCGNDGLYPGNCWRDLTRCLKLGRGDQLPSEHFVKAFRANENRLRNLRKSCPKTAVPKYMHPNNFL